MNVRLYCLSPLLLPLVSTDIPHCIHLFTLAPFNTVLQIIARRIKRGGDAHCVIRPRGVQFSPLMPFSEKRGRKDGERGKEQDGESD